MKLLTLSLLTSLISLSAFADKTPCTVSLSSGGSAAWVKDAAAESVADIGCTVVESGAKYELSWGYEWAECGRQSRFDHVVVHAFSAVAGSRGVSVTLKDAQGKILNQVSKNLYAPSLRGDTCNIMNGFVSRGTSKLVNGMIAQIKDAEASQN